MLKTASAEGVSENGHDHLLSDIGRRQRNLAERAQGNRLHHILAEIKGGLHQQREFLGTDTITYSLRLDEAARGSVESVTGNGHDHIQPEIERRPRGG